MATPPTSGRATTDELLHILMDTMVAGVRAESPDLSARQLSIFLKVYLVSDMEHTVRGLAAQLNVSKPAITRALDRLEELDFAKRASDPKDRRSVNVRRTATGSAYLRALGGYMLAASKQPKK